MVYCFPSTELLISIYIFEGHIPIRSLHTYTSVCATNYVYSNKRPAIRPLAVILRPATSPSFMAGGSGFFNLGVRLGLRFYCLGLRFQILVFRYFGAIINYTSGAPDVCDAQKVRIRFD